MAICSKCSYERTLSVIKLLSFRGALHTTSKSDKDKYLTSYFSENINLQISSGSQTSLLCVYFSDQTSPKNYLNKAWQLCNLIF